MKLKKIFRGSWNIFYGKTKIDCFKENGILKLFNLEKFMVVPSKIPNIPEGTDSREKMEINEYIWNVSNFVDRKEIS